MYKDYSLSKDHYAYFEVPYHGKDHNDYVNGAGFCCEGKDKKLQTYGGGIGKGNEEYEKMQYYDHADHLGSSSYITNLDAQIVQHVEYVPFGEVFIEERNQSWNTPYLFNGKELDEETGLYYYGARYYNPRESIFLSVDPMLEETMTPYQYTYQNPIRFTDPTGMMPDWHKDGKGNLVADKGDSAGSLAKELGISEKSAGKLLKDQGYKSYEKGGKEYTQINEGSKVQVAFSTLEAIDNNAYDIYMKGEGYVSADIVLINKIETREYSIDRTSSSRTNYEQVGSIQTTYVKPEQINTNEMYKPSNIEYYPFSNIQTSYYKYTAPRGTGNKVIEGLNGSRFSKNKLKGGKADYLGIIKEIFKSIKKK